MPRAESGFNLVDLVVLVVIVAIIWYAAPMVKQKFKVITADNACLKEAEAYAAAARRALGNAQVPAPPSNRACSGMTDASHGSTLDTRISARARPPGTARVICNLNLRESCKIP